jgi:uncharacterized protein YqjF (DUF2071 family)
MLNYILPPELLQPFVPAGTELDSWEGNYFASMVGFRFLDTKLLGIPIPFHRNFDEVNLRFYVKRIGPDGVLRRGVVFIREIVPRAAIAFLARAVYNEQYIALPMAHRVEVGGERHVEYSWKHRDRWNRLAVEPFGESAPIVQGSQEEFITEHYWGYARQRDGGTVEYQVEHPSWNIWQCSNPLLECDIASLYGHQFIPWLSAPPASAFLADGSPIAVYRGKRILP